MIAVLLGGIAAGPWMRAALRYGATVLTILLFLLALRRSGAHTGRFAERLETMEKINDVQRQMLEASGGKSQTTCRRKCGMPSVTLSEAPFDGGR